MKNKLQFFLLIGLLSFSLTNAQVGIGTTTPSASSILDIASTTKGLLIPRMTAAQQTAMTSPAIGLMIFNITTNRIEFNDGSPSAPKWVAASAKAITATNGITAASGNVKLGGALVESTTISDVTATNKLSVTATGIDAINLDSNTLSIDATNNRVGIGTAAPTRALNVVGEVEVNTPGATATTNPIVFNTGNSAANKRFYINSGAFEIQSNEATLTNPIFHVNSIGVNRVSVLGNGNLGIGTTAPSQALDVVGGTKISALAGTGSRTVVADATGVLSAIAGPTGTVSNVAGTAPINVASGTTTPVISLNDGGVTEVKIAANAVTSAKILDGTIANVDLTAGTGGIYKGSGSLSGATTVTQATNTLAFTSTVTNGFSVDGTTLSIDAANNRVGIGTAAPTTTLDVIGVAKANSYIFPAPAGDPSPVITARVVPASQGAATEKSELILFHANDGDNGAGEDQITLRAPALSFQTYTDANVADINNNAGYNERMRILPNGNVGIGTAAPSQKLDIAGTGGILNYAGLNLDPAVDGAVGTFNAQRNTGKLGIGWNRNAGDGEIALFSNRTAGSVGGFKFYDVTNTTNTAPNFLMTINGDGNVGIGSSTPGAKLDVNGTIKITGGAPGLNKILRSDATGLASWVDANTIATNNIYNANGSLSGARTVTQGTNNLTFSGASQLIKTGGPIVQGDFADGDKLLLLNSTNRAKIAHTTGYTVGNFSGSFEAGTLSGANSGAFAWSSVNATNDGWTERMRLIGNGNLGIGTTAPAAKLDVVGSGGSTVDFQTTGRAKINGSAPGLWITNSGTDKSFIGQDTSFANQALGIYSPGSGWNFNMLDNGNVGIGTSAPDTVFHIESATPIIKVGTSTDTGGAIELGNNGHGIKRNYNGDANGVGLYTTAADVHLSANGSATTQMIVKNSGNVGIGTTTPGNRLQVEQAVFQPATNDLAAIKVAGNWGGGIVFAEAANRSGIWSGGGSALNFGTGGSTAGIATRMTISNIGNVGIGTDNPLGKLHVEGGDLRISQGNGLYFPHPAQADTNDGKIGARIFDEGLNIVGVQTTAGEGRKIRMWGSLNFDAGAGTSGQILQSTGSSTSPVWVNAPTGDNLGNHTATQNLNMNSNEINNIAVAGFNNASTINAKNSSGVLETFLHPRWSDNVTYMNYGSAGFNIRNNAATSRMFIQDGGNVGIGTTAPSTKLEVVTGTSAVRLDPSGTDTLLQLKSAGAGNWTRIGSDGNPLAIFTQGDDKTSGSASMFIQNNGNVGIGRTDPTFKLDVVGDLRTTERMTITNTNPGIWFRRPNDSESSFIGSIGSDSESSFGVFSPSLGEWVFNVKRDGTVGINTTNPQQFLDVNGGAIFRSRIFLDNTNNYLIHGSEGNGGIKIFTNGAERARFNTSNGTNRMFYDGDNNIDYASDFRIKKEIVEVEPVLKDIDNIRAVQYRYKKDTENKYNKEFGVIAQDVEKAYPYLINEDKEIDPEYGIKVKRVAYTNLGVLAIKAIQELKAVVETLNAKVEKLEAELQKNKK